MAQKSVYLAINLRQGSAPGRVYFQEGNGMPFDYGLSGDAHEILRSYLRAGTSLFEGVLQVKPVLETMISQETRHTKDL